MPGKIMLRSVHIHAVQHNVTHKLFYYLWEKRPCFFKCNRDNPASSVGSVSRPGHGTKLLAAVSQKTNGWCWSVDWGMPWSVMTQSSMLWMNGWLSWTHQLIPTLYFWFSKVLAESSPTSFFLFSSTNSAATWAGRTFSSSNRVRFSHSSISSLSVRFLFFSRNSWRQQNSSCRRKVS